MKNLYLFLKVGFIGCIYLITFPVHSQQIKLKNIDEGINRLWNRTPGKIIDPLAGDDAPCEANALQRARSAIVNKDINDGLTRSFRITLSRLGDLLPGGYAKIAFESLVQTINAATAESPEEFAAQATRSALGKIGNYAGKRINNEDIETAFNKAYKKIIEQLIKAPENSTTEIKTSNTQIAPCDISNYSVNLIWPTNLEPGVQPAFNLTYDFNESYCNCQPPGNPKFWYIKMKEHNVIGNLPMTIESIKEKKKWFVQDEIQITFAFDQPHYQVTAVCCQGSENSGLNDSTYIEPIEDDNQKTHEYYIGYSALSEYTKPRFLMHGLGLAYIWYFRQHLGLMANMGINFGNNYDINYSRLLLMAGLTYKIWLDHNRWALNPYFLAGYNNLSAKYMGEPNRTGNFSIAAGTLVRYQLKPNLAPSVMLDYNPVFSSGNTAKNFRFGAGVILGFNNK